MYGQDSIDIESIIPFLAQLLGLTGYCLLPEFCKVVGCEWIIAVTPRDRPAVCLHCGSCHIKLNGTITRIVRHAPVGVKHTKLKIIIPRILCQAKKCGKTSMPDLPGVQRSGSISDDLAVVFLDRYSARETFGEIALHTGASPSTVARWLRRLIDALDSTRTKTLPATIGIDETRIHDGDDGLWTVLTDLETGSTIDVLPKTDQDELVKFVQRQDDISQVKGISSDGAQHYIDFARQFFSEAIRTRDRFHIMQDMLKGLHDARRAANKTKKEEKDNPADEKSTGADSDSAPDSDSNDDGEAA